MRPTVLCSSRYRPGYDTHDVDVLVRLEGDPPPARLPINVALVLDRSGSMRGAPFAAAREAARRFCRLLRPTDRISIVVFDTAVHTVLGPTAGDDPRLAAALTSIDTGATTNLAGGWTAGRDHVAEWRGNGVNRVILLTDGKANVGVTDPDALAELAREARSAGVSTTCIGFGPRFNEDLLRAMSGAGGGHFWYVERVGQMSAIFDEEIEGLVALAARNVTVNLELDHLGASEVSLVQPLPMFRLRPRSLQVQPGDLYATSPLDLCFTFRITDASATGAIRVGQVQVAGDVVRAGGVTRYDQILPLVVPLERADRVDPVVERAMAWVSVARAREEAIRLADQGEYHRASAALVLAAERLEPWRDDPTVAAELEDLQREIIRLATGEWRSEDRKYHAARSNGLSLGKQAYLDKIARRRR